MFRQLKDHMLRRSYRPNISISFCSLIFYHFILLMGIVTIIVHKGVDAIEVPNTNRRILVNPQSGETYKEGRYQNVVSFEESSKNDKDSNSTSFSRTLSNVKLYNDTLEDKRYDFGGCYRRIEIGKRLMSPSVTDTFENTADDIKCREKCENYKLPCIGYSFGFLERETDKIVGVCDVLGYSEDFSNPSKWTMRAVAGGKRFVVFQRNMNCLDNSSYETSEERNISIPNRKILTGKTKDNAIRVMSSSLNNTTEKQMGKYMNPRERQPRKFFVSVSSPSANDHFNASPVDTGQYSANSVLDKKVSFASQHESNLKSLASTQLHSWSMPITKSYRYPEKSYKSIRIPSKDAPIIFSASASVGQLLNTYQSGPTSTKNIDLKVTYVHSPSSESPSPQNPGCVQRKKLGYRHRHETFRKQCTVISSYSLKDCSEQCRKNANCRSFSFRYDSVENWPSGINKNCILSTAEISPLPQRKMIVNDKDWDLYKYDRSRQTCRNSFPDLTAKRECYIKTNRIGYKFFVSGSRSEHVVRDKRACSEECSRQISCRIFSFRIRTSALDQRASLVNCQLSNLPTNSLVSSDLEYSPNWVIYDKLGGKECETAILLNQNPVPTRNDPDCAHNGYVLDSSVVSRAISTQTKQECSRQCKALEFCRTYAYSPRVVDSFELPRFNCQLSSLATRSITVQDRISHVHGNICEITNTRIDAGIQACSSEFLGETSNDGVCHKQQCTGYRHYSNSFRDSLRVRDIEECSNRCAATSYCKTFSYKHGVESSIELNCLLSSFSIVRLDTTRDLSTDINWNLYRRISNAQCNNNENDRHDNNNNGRDCVSTIQSESRHRTRQIRQVTSATSLSDCANRCRTLYFCRSISYRNDRSLFDNCLLSDTRIDGFGRYNNLEQKFDWTVYRINPNCNGGGGGGDCFEEYRRDYRFDTQVIRETDRYARTRRDCERACNNARFRCLGFAYGNGYSGGNSGGYSGGSEQCELVDQDPRSMSSRDLNQDRDFTVYRKNSNCGLNGGGSGTNNGNIRCSRQYRQGSRLSSSSVRQNIDARDKNECENRCISETSFECRAFSYSYNTGGNSGSSFRNNRNCELSDQRLQDGTGNYGSGSSGGLFGSGTGSGGNNDITYDRDWTIYERTQYSGQCSSGRYGGGSYNNNNNNYGNNYNNNYGNNGNYNNNYNNNNYNNNYNNNNNGNRGGLDCYERYRRGYTIDGRAVSRTAKVSSLEDCARECDRERGGSTRGRGCNAFSFEDDEGVASVGLGSTYGVEKDCLLSDENGRGIENDLRNDDNFEVWEYRAGNCRNGNGNGFRNGYNRNDNNRRQQAVSGINCNTQTVFDTKDKYWYCETNDRDYEYCCRPGSSCGYSENYEYPWCYVGNSRSDRWRPCDRTLVEDDGILRDGRAQVSKKVSHSSEPSINRRAPDKYRSNWYSRVNSGSQQANKDNFNIFSGQDPKRPSNRPILGSATSSNGTAAVVKFGF